MRPLDNPKGSTLLVGTALTEASTMYIGYGSPKEFLFLWAGRALNFWYVETNKVADNKSKAVKTFNLLILFILKDHLS